MRLTRQEPEALRSLTGRVDPLPHDLSPEEMDALRGCDSAQEYAVVCQCIKNARGGEDYPLDWWEHVMAPGGIHDHLRTKWGQTDFCRVIVGMGATLGEAIEDAVIESRRNQ